MRNFIRLTGLFFVLTLSALVSLPVELWAQQGLAAYDRGEVEEVRRLLDEGKLDPVEADFLRAALTPEAEVAVDLYRRLIVKYPESPIRRRAMERLQQYYYALGNYTKAQEIEAALAVPKTPEPSLEAGTSLPPEQTNHERKELVPPQKTEEDATKEKSTRGTYCLQVGAFSKSSNAQVLKEKLEKAGYSVVLLPPAETPFRLYAVRVTGFTTEQQAKAAADALRTKLELKAIIIPPDQLIENE